MALRYTPPPLPETYAIGLVFGGCEYEHEWTRYDNAYDEEQMKAYGEACAKAMALAMMADLEEALKGKP